MDPRETRELGRRVRQRLEEQLARGDLAAADRECTALAKEYVLVHKGLRKVLEYALEHVEAVFRTEQAAIAERITAAVRAGDVAGARELLAERDRQHEVVHDRFIDFKASLYSYAGSVFGDRGLEGILRHTGERQRAGFERWEAMSVEDFVRATAHLLRSHMTELQVTEDDERFTITQDPCGSGGRLMREGAYQGERGQHRVREAQPMTFGKPDFPSYCAHCAVWNAIQCIEWFGHPQWCIDHPATPADPCRIHIYKNPGRIPERYWEQVGKRHARATGGDRSTGERDDG